MTSEIRTNSLKSRAGLSTVTLTDSGPMFSGITTFVDNSGFNIGTGSSIFSPAANTLNIGVNNTESLGIDSSSNLKIAGVCTATHFYGNGSNLTGITGTTINNYADNRVVTATGSANTLNAESNVHIDGSGRLMVGTTTEGHAAGDNLTVADSGNCGITIRSGTSNGGNIYFSDGTSGADEYRGIIYYDHASNYMGFWTNGNSERLRIESGGDVDIKSGVLKLGSGANRRLMYRSGNNDVILEADSGDFYRQDIANSTHEFFTGNIERLRITSDGDVNAYLSAY